MSNKLLLAAVLPSIVLLVYIYRKDKIEKEPLGMLVGLFLLGGLTTISATILELAGARILMMLPIGNTAFIALDNFLVIGLAEEGGKYFVLKKRTWRSPHFNFTFDAVVYAVVVSLGFATVENILYVWSGGMSTAIARAIFSIPGHTIFGVFMGCYYGMARLSVQWGNPASVKGNLRKALWMSTLTHGAYDFCLSMEHELFSWLFLAYMVFITVTAFRQVKQLSAHDMPV